jgi:hypothetical protein
LTPQILLAADFEGRHNSGIEKSVERLETAVGYKNLSTIVITPTRGGASLSPKWVSSMMALVKPMNQKFIGPVFFAGFEVGEAYNKAVQMIFAEPKLANIKYMLTWEDDVIPQPDALLKLYETQIKTGADVVSALYWNKGEDGQPMIYGDINDPVPNFRPQKPVKDGIIECYGTGMGFTLYDLDQFKTKVPGPNWFETVAEWQQGEGVRQATQDLEYAYKLSKAGGKFVVNCAAKAAHYDCENDILW